MWIGSLALAGVPLFAGYYSKDLIIESAWVTNSLAGQYAFWMGAGAAFLTALYSWRLIFMTFHGKPRMTKETFDHVHDAPKVMWMPLIVLAIGAIFAGYSYTGGKMVFHGGEAFFERSVAFTEVAPGEGFTVQAHDEMAEIDHDDEASESDSQGDDGHSQGRDVENVFDIIDKAHLETPLWVKIMVLLFVASGIGTAYVCYILKPHLPGLIASQFRPVYKFLLNKWYFDELFDRIFVFPAMRLGMGLWKAGDQDTIDGLGPDGVAAATMNISRRVKILQSGYVYHYAFAMLIGLVVVASWFLFRAWG
ncbi:MAG: hypothetical protein ACKVH7_17265, partial [Alphaproteobacteria bacterium]